MQPFYAILNLAGRILVTAIFLIAGAGKFADYAGTQALMDAKGIPGMLLPLVIALEIGAGLAVAAGFQARVAAFLLAGFSLLTAVIFHSQPGDPMQAILFWKNVAIAGGLFIIVANGAGAWSMDQRLARD